MKRILTTLFCLVFAGAATAQAQVIRISRVDAQPEKSHFVTATLPFSVEIALEGINNVTAVSFELRYNNAGSIQLSGYSGGSFGSNGLLVLDKSNRISGAGSINIGALSGQPAGGGGVNDPIVVRLDFITTPDAQHNTNTVFSFINTEAVADGSIIKLAGVPVVYNIHGFLDIWPGDADNNGIVDTRDISIIGLFFDDGGADGRIRGFSRKPASTAWAPQTALAWDSVRVTYADADGSGKVDINDMLVVYANFSKTHMKFHGSDGDVMSSRPSGTEEAVLSPTSQLVPVTLSSPQPLLGAAATISWKHLAGKFNVLGFQRGEAFGSGEGFFTKIDNAHQSAQFAVGNFNPGQEVSLEGSVIYLAVEPLTEETEFSFDIERPVGIRRSGAMVPLGATTSIELPTTGDTKIAVYPNPASGYTVVSFEATRPGTVAVSLVDATGHVVYRTAEHVEAGSVNIPVDGSAIATGVYFLMVETESGTSVRPFSIIH